MAYQSGGRRGGYGGGGSRRPGKSDPFLADPKLKLDWKDARLLKRFLADNGKILPRRMTGLCAKNQRAVARAVKLARQAALLPYPGHDG